MGKNEIKEKLSTIVTKSIGHTIDVDNIHTDESGWSYYIPAQSLQANHPLILNHYRGPFFMVIPIDDWKKLENEEISVQEYVDNSTWNFGYLWGGGNMLYGSHWQPFEEKGIHDKERISRYLTILGCRTNRVSSGYMPTTEHCMTCSIEHCPFSRCEEKREGASWENEVDDRILLYEAVKQRIKEQFGLETVDCLNHEEDTICILPSYRRDTVVVYLPQKLLIDMLYNPNKYNIKEIANNLKIKIGIPWHFNDNDEVVPVKSYDTTADTNVETFYDYWKKECPERVYKWFDEDVKGDNCMGSKKNDLNFFDALIEYLQKLF